MQTHIVKALRHLVPVGLDHAIDTHALGAAVTGANLHLALGVLATLGASFLAAWGILAAWLVWVLKRLEHVLFFELIGRLVLELSRVPTNHTVKIVRN